MDELTAQVKSRYDKISKQIAEHQTEIEKLKKEQKPAFDYLVSAGVLEKPKRGRKAKS